MKRLIKKLHLKIRGSKNCPRGKFIFQGNKCDENGVQHRFRSPENERVQCLGESSENRPCLKTCWSEWGSWSERCDFSESQLGFERSNIFPKFNLISESRFLSKISDSRFIVRKFEKCFADQKGQNFEP